VLDGGAIVHEEFESVAVGRAHACGIAATTSSSTRDVECWGANDQGQAGLPFSSMVNQPHRLGLGQQGAIKQVAAGGDGSCVLFENGTLLCWGAAGRGQLGPATMTATQVPTPITFPPGATPIAVTMGDAHACALLSNYTVMCWGDDTASQLGTVGGSGTFSATPVAVTKYNGHSLGGVQAIAAGGDTTCAILLLETEVSCWGANDRGQAGQPPGPPVHGATHVSW
jgi:alpha-tubulin suppressor-like RCC1 family protein